MTTTDMLDHPHYAAIAGAIDYLVRHREDQPTLDELAARAAMHPHHFQRVFKKWVGISPKRFAQALTLDLARRLLSEADESVLITALDSGLSGPSRLHDLFVACEAVTPGEFRRRGEGLTLRYGIHLSPLGPCLIAVTSRGVSWLGFGEERRLRSEFKADWPAAETIEDPSATAPVAARIFDGEPGGPPIRLDLHGTNFQIQVWRALLGIPEGRCATYGQIAHAIGKPSASRAVGAAVGSNPIALLIPCHRVIKSSGIMHNYRWGAEKKQTILALEGARGAA